MTDAALELLALLSPTPAPCAALAHDLGVSRGGLRDLASQLIGRGFMVQGAGRGRSVLVLPRRDYMRARRECEIYLAEQETGAAAPTHAG